MELKALKKEYDQALKSFYDDPGLFQTGEYDVYFTDSYFRSNIVERMKESDYIAYKRGAGGELKKHKNNGIIVHASMSSVGSSSRFCYLSLKDSDFSVFGIKNTSYERRFEEKMQVVRGTPPHMDCYLEDDDEIVCFECKCHEQFDDHKISLSTSYFNKNRIVTNISDNYYIKKSRCEIDKKGKKHFYNDISPKFIGLSDNPRFDIKQFLTHIMGIQTRLNKSNKKTGRLVYFYFIPDKILNNDKIKGVIDSLYEEIKVVFDSDFIARYASNIKFELYVQYSNTIETACSENTRKIY